MATFGLTPGSSDIDIIGGLNYALANIATTNPNSLIANTSTGQINIPTTGGTVSYLYRYIFIAYATSSDGVQNFAIGNPSNATYYGIRNSNSSAPSSNPASYVWYSVPGGFGTTKFLFYTVIGGGSINFQIGTGSPGDTWAQDNGSAIDLTISTSILNTTATTGYILSYNVGGPVWVAPSAITAGNATNAVNVKVNDSATGHNYYLALASSRDGTYSTLLADAGLNLITYSSTSSNVLVTNNLQAYYNITATTITAGYITVPSISTTNITATNLVATTGQVSAQFTATYINSNYINSPSITTTNITATNLVATTGQISAQFTATNISSNYLSSPSIQSTNITATNLIATTGQVSGQFTATYINSNYVNSPSIQSTNITATNIVSTNANISSQFTATQANITSLISLTPLTASPGTVSAGTLVVAHGPNWDPAGYSTTTNYVAFYNGTAWVKLG